MIWVLGGAHVTDAPAVWTDEYRVRAYEVGADGRATLPAVCNWLQETAGNHATALGWAVDSLQAQGRTWMLVRLHLRLGELPGWRDEVRVTTWPAGVHRLFALREFRIDGGDGRELGIATTGWVLLDLAAHRPVRALAEVEAIARNAPGRVLDDPFGRLPETENPDSETAVEVRFADLDMNHHANNVSVISWALEALPEEVVLGAACTELEVDFRSEARHGEAIGVRAQREPGRALAFRHTLVRAGDAREIARARSAWAADPR